MSRSSSPLATTVLLQGYLQKKSIRKGNYWNKRYFVLNSDGRLSYSTKKNAPPKATIALDAQSRITAIPRDELRGDKGFALTTRATEVLFVKSSKQAEIDQWEKAIRKLLAEYGQNASSRRQVDANSYYASGQALRKLGSKATMAVPPSIPGYVMKVGKSKNSGDYFVNSNTLEYYRDEQSCINGEKPEGKITLELIV